MPAPISMDLRLRIIRAVESGSSMGGAVQRFAVSPSAAIKQMQPGARGRQRRPARSISEPVRYGSASSPKATLSGLPAAQREPVHQRYDLNAPWRHEVRVEQVPGYLARRHEVVALPDAAPTPVGMRRAGTGDPVEQPVRAAGLEVPANLVSRRTAGRCSPSPGKLC